MTKLFSATFALLLLICGNVASAQERTITEDEFFAFKNTAMQAWRKSPYREKRTSHTKEVTQSDWMPFTVEEYEYIRPDRMYSRVINVGLGETEPSTERITVAGNSFIRYKGRNWQAYKMPAISETSAATGEQPEKPVVECKHLGIVVLKGQRATLIQKTHSRKEMRNGKELLVINVEKAWLDDAGRFLQQEFLTTRPPERSFLQTIVYDYDPNIKIEAPQLK